ncbi:hypothetical protein F2Q70_00034224 [Brassica cretica]|uniref:Uncharacterized protein n=1 Tax=Brassica cretica TaxID=69181 RepID=A0A8S9JPL8_BRACR|nr:hypothetical protein F2Q70_00034224 [Brassica cretica]
MRKQNHTAPTPLFEYVEADFPPLLAEAPVLVPPPAQNVAVQPVPAVPVQQQAQEDKAHQMTRRQKSIRLAHAKELFSGYEKGEYPAS